MEAELLQGLQKKLVGELFFNDTMRTLYATDASAYREMPLAVAIPASEKDLLLLVAFAAEHKTSLIPRTAGTSLAGQVVGSGIVVDVSVNFRDIIEVNKQDHWVRVQPGVIRDDLNRLLAKQGLFFGPETSTSSRCMIGGMVGNNACGARSVIYGSTRDHLLEIKAILSDGTQVTFKNLSNKEFLDKVNGVGIAGPAEHRIYTDIHQLLSNQDHRDEIKKEFPKPEINRRNTGYAIDLLMDTNPFLNENSTTENDFNFCKLIAGSEGTLCLITEIKINCEPVLSEHVAMMCPHFNSIDESLRANLIALKSRPSQVELMDDIVLECTKANLEQKENRGFVSGDPKAILMIEIHRNSKASLTLAMQELATNLKAAGYGYHFPVLYGKDINKALTLRKAGLGLLANIPGDDNAQPVIEDTAVDVNDLPDFIAEFNEIMNGYGQKCVHYAHAGTGEIHLRPVLNMKTKEGHELYRKSAEDISKLVKKYKGSLSGEHGDGRLRGEFIEYMIGAKNYQLIKQVKKSWDPDNIFNPNKIVDTPPMDTHLRYQIGQETKQLDTEFSFADTDGILRAAEKCNGSGDCRKSELSGGTMCPSFMATKNEKHTTRARANILREVLTNSDKLNAFDSEEIKEVMDLCLSCKGCKKECPSNVDVAKLKAEFLQQYYNTNGIPFRSKMIANVTSTNRIASLMPGLYNWISSNKITGNLIKEFMGFAKERPIPPLAKTTLHAWFKKNKSSNFGEKSKKSLGTVLFFNDEFTNFLDVSEGITAIKLLAALGFKVEMPKVTESGRTFLSKGLVKEAKKRAIKNIELLKGKVSKLTPMVGIEPSAILTFRDEYPDLVSDAAVKEIAEHTFFIDEFISEHIKKGNITADQFSDKKELIKFHGHCHQKAQSSLTHTKRMLSLPENYTVHTIPSGCCGMAGSFGYEKEHYETSMQVGELVLFPTVRKQEEDTIIVAPGTSCRHQIKDGTGRKALHTVEVLYHALK